MRTLLEQSMIAVSQSIRCKENWRVKMKTPSIVAKWKQESRLNEEAFQYVLDELQWYDSLRDGNMEPAAVDGVWQADNLIPQHLRQRLLASVAILEDVPDNKKDWHPGSNNQVLDLVHPSLYCLTYGRSRSTTAEVLPSLNHMGGGEILQPPAIDSTDYSASCKYQWLPSEFQILPDGKVRINSYINNLHPILHKQLYYTLEEIFELFVPLLSKCLGDLTVSRRPLRVRFDWRSIKRAREEKNRKKRAESNNRYYQDDDEDNPEDEIPIIRPFSSDGLKFYTNSPIIDLHGRTLQVIVKLANIILTPENPNYNGGSWHMEGMVNESIVASCIYYYHSENITESMLDFREAVCPPTDHTHADDGELEFLCRVYGLGNNDHLNQEMGGVITKQDRCIAFGNDMQHRVAPFHLLDNTKPGLRKILVFFIVDPNTRITSTLHVPPQQKEWYYDVLRRMSCFRRMPPDVVKEIIGWMDWPMSLEEAKVHREGLMKERKYFVETDTNKVYEREFYLCEH